MPLAFNSVSHGRIAFGFFNIETDLLLLDRYFIFAPEFCRHMAAWAGETGPLPWVQTWQVSLIDRIQNIGDLMGAIEGVRYLGFIGEVYRRFPFPQDPAGFRQKTDGVKNRDEINQILDRFGRDLDITCLATDLDRVFVGDYEFTRRVFHELIHYVWLGGYPRWQDDTPPDYVYAMKQAIDRSDTPFFESLKLT